MQVGTIPSRTERRTIAELLGRGEEVPLCADSMARGLIVRRLAADTGSARAVAFAARLDRALGDAGVRLLDEGQPGEASVLIAVGPLADGALPVDRVKSLRKTTLVGIFDGPCPALDGRDAQERLDLLVGVLSWNIVQVAIFVDDDGWTLGTMNGALERYAREADLDRVVREVLVPKLAAPVVPPHASDFCEIAPPRIEPELLESFAVGAARWAESKLLLLHTPLASLSFRDRRYERIARAYLDSRSGMSYGFLAWQLPLERTPDDRRVELFGETFQVPTIRMLCTRSGCDKSRIDVERDLMVLELRDGAIGIAAVGTRSAEVEQRPSYDTLTILAHGLANALVAERLDRVRPQAAFGGELARRGRALAHWHGGLDPSRVAPGYHLHGSARPPVSCSTPQSALYAVLGKLEALDAALANGEPFIGDVHVEPLHGTNLSGPTLTELARHAVAWA